MSLSDRSGRDDARLKHYKPLKVLDERGRSCVLEALPNAILTVSREGVIEDANAAAESFFELGKPLLIGQQLERLLPFGSPLLTLIQHVQDRGAAINEYKVDLGRPGQEGDRRVDVHCAPLPDSDGLVLVVLQERTIADKIDRQLSHRGAVRSVSGLASMLAHEIKNPLSGIRGAAQLLESGLSDADRALTRLICEETDRIVRLVDRMEVFSDARPLKRERVNIHSVLDHVKQVAQSGFARRVRFVENYDPSLPPVYANRDQLIQAFLNLVKNAAEAIGDDASMVRSSFPPPSGPASAFAALGARQSRRPAAGILRARQRARRSGRYRRPSLRSLCHHEIIRALASVLHWSRRSSMTTAASSNANSLPRRTTFRILMPMYRARHSEKSSDKTSASRGRTDDHDGHRPRRRMV